MKAMKRLKAMKVAGGSGTPGVVRMGGHARQTPGVFMRFTPFIPFTS